MGSDWIRGGGVMSAVVIPEKQYFKIGEISDILQLEPYVLRYWESEFKILKPSRTRSKHRLYHRKDLEILVEIKHLLYDEKLTIAGAKRRLQMDKKKAMTEKKTLKMIKSSTSNKNSDGKVVRLKDGSLFENPDDYRELLLDIKKELEILRSTISG
jgi:DNA-binding transcriptional MerR regulator